MHGQICFCFKALEAVYAQCPHFSGIFRSPKMETSGKAWSRNSNLCTKATFRPSANVKESKKNPLIRTERRWYRERPSLFWLPTRCYWYSRAVKSCSTNKEIVNFSQTHYIVFPRGKKMRMKTWPDVWKLSIKKALAVIFLHSTTGYSLEII